eukprot:gene12056-5552_t
MRCNKKYITQYNFGSKISSFGGKKGEEVNIKGVVDVQCVRRKGINFFYVVVPFVKMSQKIHGHKQQKVLPGKTREFSVFTLTKTGRLAFFVNSRRHEHLDRVGTMLYNIRKTIASFYQADLNGNGKRLHTRVEKSPEGLVRATYTYSRKKHQKRVVRRVRSSDVMRLLGANKGQQRRDVKFRLTTSFLVKRGKLMRVNQRFVSIVGARSKADATYKNLKKKIRKRKISSKSRTRSKHLQDVLASTRLQYAKSYRVKRTRKKGGQHVLDVLDANKLDEDLDLFSKSLGVEKEDLSMSQATHNFALAAHREKLEKTTNFPDVLNKLSQNARDTSLFNRALEYTKTFSKKALDVLVAEYKKPETMKNILYQKTLHTLLAATQSKVAEKLLLNAMSNGNTTQSAMTNIISLSKPSDEVVHTLQALSETKELGALSSQAYLLFAHTAAKTENKKLAAHVVGKIVMDMSKSTSQNTFGYHVRALANAGEAVPLEVLSKLIQAEHIPLDSRIDAAHALQHRVNDDHEETTDLIHKVLDSNVHEELKTALIQAQTKREKVLENFGSIVEFEKHVMNDDTPHSVLHAIQGYYQESVPHLLEKVAKEENLSADDENLILDVKGLDANVLWGVRRFFRRAVRRVSHAARRAADKARRARRWAAERARRARRWAAERARRARRAADRARRWAAEKARRARRYAAERARRIRRAADRARRYAIEKAKRARRWAAEKARRARQAALRAADRARRFAIDKARRARAALARARAWAKKQAQKRLKQLRAVARKAKDFGFKVVKTVKKGAGKAWKGIKKVANKIKNAFNSLLNKAKRLFNQIKQKVAAKAQLSDRRRVCVRTSVGKKLCSYNSHAMSYVQKLSRKFDLKMYQSSSPAVFEKVVGIKLLYLYFGVVAFAGSNQPVKCSDENLQFIAFQRAGLQVGMFGKVIPVFSADAYIRIDRRNHVRKTVKDRFRLTLVGKLHMWDLALVPKSMEKLDNCYQLQYDMMDESFDFFSFKITIMAGPVPITFSFGVTGSFSLYYSFSLCHESQVYSLEVEPEFTLGPTVSAGIGVALLSGGINGELTTGYSLPAVLAQTECNRCAQLKTVRKPLQFKLSIYFDLLVTRFEKDLYSKTIAKTASRKYLKCADKSPSAVDDWDPEEGITPSKVAIKRIKFTNNLLLNLLVMRVTQRKWLKIVKAYLALMDKNMVKIAAKVAASKGGRKGKKGKRGGRRRSRKNKRSRRRRRRRSNKKRRSNRRRKRRSNKKRRNSNKKRRRRRNKRKGNKKNRRKGRKQSNKCRQQLAKGKKALKACVATANIAGKNSEYCNKAYYALQLKCSKSKAQKCFYGCRITGTSEENCKTMCDRKAGCEKRAEVAKSLCLKVKNAATCDTLFYTQTLLCPMTSIYKKCYTFFRAIPNRYSDDKAKKKCAMLRNRCKDSEIEANQEICEENCDGNQVCAAACKVAAGTAKKVCGKLKKIVEAATKGKGKRNNGRKGGKSSRKSGGKRRNGKRSSRRNRRRNNKRRTVRRNNRRNRRRRNNKRRPVRRNNRRRVVRRRRRPQRRRPVGRNNRRRVVRRRRPVRRVVRRRTQRRRPVRRNNRRRVVRRRRRPQRRRPVGRNNRRRVVRRRRPVRRVVRRRTQRRRPVRRNNRRRVVRRRRRPQRRRPVGRNNRRRVVRRRRPVRRVVRRRTQRRRPVRRNNRRRPVRRSNCSAFCKRFNNARHVQLKNHYLRQSRRYQNYASMYRRRRDYRRANIYQRHANNLRSRYNMHSKCTKCARRVARRAAGRRCPGVCRRHSHSRHVQLRNRYIHYYRVYLRLANQHRRRRNYRAANHYRRRSNHFVSLYRRELKCLRCSKTARAPSRRLQSLRGRSFHVRSQNERAIFNHFNMNRPMYFRIRGFDLYLTFCQNPRIGAKCYFFILNGWRNTHSWFGLGSVNRRYHAHSTRKIQYHRTPRIHGTPWYWVRFTGRRFQVGRGRHPGRYTVMNVYLRNYFRVNSVAFSRFAHARATVYNVRQ